MRLKIIAVFSILVLIVGGLSWIVAASVASVPADPQTASKALQGAVAQFQLEGVATQRWLVEQTKNPNVRDAFAVAESLVDQRNQKATSSCDEVFAAAQKAELPNVKPHFVAIVNADGITLGRDHLTERNTDFGKVYPELKTALAAKLAGNGAWMNKGFSHHDLVAWAPLLDSDGKVLGGIVMGWLIDDPHLSYAASKAASLALMVRNDAAVTVEGTSEGADQALVGKLGSPDVTAALGKAGGTEATDIPGLPGGARGTARPLAGFGDTGKQVFLVSMVAAPPSAFMKLLPPIGGVTLFALVLVAIAGYLLGGYIMRPVTEIEEGLLGIINGQTNRRFELEHAELGGVVSSLNSLLNQLFGVTEDDTDEEGRPSHAPTAKAFRDAIAVDEKMGVSGPGSSTSEAEALKNEPAEAYQARIYKEYIAAKRQVGDPTDHITRDEFLGRIATSEAEMAEKHGKPVRYKVEVKGKEVMLIAIPLG